MTDDIAAVLEAHLDDPSYADTVDDCDVCRAIGRIEQRQRDLEEAIATAMTSLETGHGYAYAVLKVTTKGGAWS